MPKVPVYDMAGQAVGELELSERVFGAEINRALLHSVRVASLANRRVGTASTLDRSQVSGGGRKPWRQKGTGRARHGSIRSPLWRGGGIVFGPRPRDYSQRLTRRMRRQALASALSAKVRDGGLVVVEGLELAEPKTREMRKVLDSLRASSGALVVTATGDEAVYRSARNLPGVKVSRAGDLNAYDVLCYPSLVMTREAVARVEEALGR
ncbi:MAG: 50S ribosomal protein L4 [Acetobacteraceae bacterium]|nr:50S ribosomal protein L4 [Acetobacteraceae bacterium]